MAHLKDVTLNIEVDVDGFRRSIEAVAKVGISLERANRSAREFSEVMARVAVDIRSMSQRVARFIKQAQADDLRRRTEVIRLREGDHQWQVEQWRKWGLLDTQEQVLEAARGAMGHGNDGSLALAFLKAGPAR